MIARILLFIKHRMPWLWIGVDWLNARLYSLLHQKNMDIQADRAFREFALEGFCFRRLASADLNALHELLRRQDAERLRFFSPHGFDPISLRKMLNNPAFLMFCAFRNGSLVGYFFLRCFWNRKCFVGRLIDEPYEGQGIGRVMNQIMYHTAWWSGFRCFTSISRNNKWIMRAHAKNPHATFVTELANDYQLVEFLPVTGENPSTAKQRQ
ncbi:MAG TPA: hypothetical protein VJ904_13110 [Tichowtungia sp.]|nr:hypothetical protein [Tichowtungia sp.]